MNIDAALNIAVHAHAGQVDKAGAPYILHPLRLMHKFEANEYQIVALLHDVLEDSEYTVNDLRNAGFSDLIIDAILCLTKQKEESYDAFIERVSKNAIAKKVKIEDIKDNLNIARIKSNLQDSDIERLRRYHSALTSLES